MNTNKLKNKAMHWYILYINKYCNIQYKIKIVSWFHGDFNRFKWTLQAPLEKHLLNEFNTGAQNRPRANALIVQQICTYRKGKESVWVTDERHLETLLFGPPFDQQVFVEQAPRLMPDSGISSGYGLHSSSMLQLTGTWIRHSCKTKQNLFIPNQQMGLKFCFQLVGPNSGCFFSTSVFSEIWQHVRMML